MDSFYQLFCKFCISLLISTLFSSTIFANDNLLAVNRQGLLLQKQPGFFRFSFDNIKMPNDIADTGLLGLNYFANITPEFYAGISGYGSVTGTQGGLFVLGIAGGYQRTIIQHLWADVGLFVGGGGGRAYLVGGGLMVRPHAGVFYEFPWSRFGIYYSYITFPSGLIHSQQVGVNVDIPFDFYYVSASEFSNESHAVKQILLPLNNFLNFARNDFAIILQRYQQRKGTRNIYDMIQDHPIGLVGAEFEHYFADQFFWYVKTSGAFSGIPNGYMDLLGGVGYHLPLLSDRIAFIPQFGIGAGGGGHVDTEGGILIQPQLGLELPLSSNFSARLSGGYLWAPKGELSAYTLTAALIYHLNIATAAKHAILDDNSRYYIQGWRAQVFNQTYFYPQRTFTNTTSPIQLIVVQIDQLFSPIFFLSYQAAFAYAGFHAGGYATGMIGPGIQTMPWLHDRLQLFGELLVGAGGGGGLALGGGAIIEPVVGLHYALTPSIGLQMSSGELMALRHDLNTPVLNLGLTIRFGTLNRE